MLDPTRTVRHREQRHAGLLRRVAAFADVAGEAGADDVFPAVAAALGQRHDVVAREFAAREMFAAVQAEHAVAREQRGVGQRRGGIDRVQARVAAARDDRVQIERGLFAGEPAHAAVDRETGVA